MTQQEFENRVKMQVSCDEYKSIEQVYCNSDVDKDEFCRLWVKMNYKRVFAAREEQKRIEGLQALNEKVWDIYYKYNHRDAIWKMVSLPCDVLTKKEIGILTKADIYYDYIGFDRCNNMSGLLCEIHDYLKKQMAA